MIKISLDSNDGTASFSFDKETIIIGDGPEGTVDFCFPIEGLHKNHVKIVFQNNEYWAINQANDPFVSLNGHPFWKKKLIEGDILAIRAHSLKIEEFLDAPIGQSPVYTADNSSRVSPLIEEAYNLEQQQPPRKKNKALHAKPKAGSKKLMKLAILFCLSTTTAFGLIFFEVYFRTANKIDREEMFAAESIADYAMALQYAKVYHIAPQKQNWIDPQFLKNNLVDLLSTTSIPCGNIDAQGQFSNCPYILRFYTNRDFSRFILIAQPDATFSEWIIPKKTLIVDSSLMEIHKTDDLKTLNRLLSYPTPLDGSNGDEVKRAILQTDVISLADLSKETGKKEFSPPSALAYMKPGAENLIYNAPRYHQFGETFLKKALALTEEKFLNHDMDILQSELDILAKFHDLVFYSSEGLKHAFKGQKALQKLVIPTNFFTGYLVFSKEGKITGSRLTIDNDFFEHREEPKELVADNFDTDEPLQKEATASKEIILANQLREKMEIAQEEIGPIIHNLYTILEDALEKDSLFLPQSAMQLFDLYLLKQESLRKSLQKTVEDLKSEYNIKEMTINHLLREYGLLDFYNSDPIKPAKKDQEEELTFENWQSFQNLHRFNGKKLPIMR